jgi:hypothetical protein
MRSKVYEHTHGQDIVITYGVSVTDSDLIMTDGKSLEGVGVVPDNLMLPAAADLAAGRDPVLAHAASLVGLELNAAKAGTLEEAGLSTAGKLILSAELEGAAELVRQARLANPELRVLARCAHLREAGALRRAGAIVIAGEAEVAAALAEATIAEEGAAPEQVAEQREQIRRELYESTTEP